MGRFTRSERRIARLLLTEPAVGTDTVSLLARRAGVSAPTVVRFARRCGFPGYPALREALRAELATHTTHATHAELTTHAELATYDELATYAEPRARDASGAPAVTTPSPRTRPGGTAPHTAPPTAPHTTAARAATLLAEATRETLTSLPAAELDAAVRLLGSERNRVFLDGGRFTGVLAQCLELRLMGLRDGVRRLPDHPVQLAAVARDLRRSDVVVLFDHRPYEERTARLAHQAKAAGARILLFTDPTFSPVTEIADVVLTAAVRSPSPRASLVPTLALIEALVTVLAGYGARRPTRG
ncbi:MurR/RpiR family transcriptional regulator [Streptomyces flavalbus]|uniref:MurR/RpiR family transcriptional regulator n=1 Tax=Streptomyces flavalbus TaxID=2665155 RepID=A0ABW2WI23_9ACTN